MLNFVSICTAVFALLIGSFAFEARARIVNSDQAFMILELEAGATPAQLKTARNRMLYRYHPDRLAQLDPAPSAETIEDYKQRTRQVIEAYQFLTGSPLPVGQADSGSTNRDRSHEFGFDSSSSFNRYKFSDFTIEEMIGRSGTYELFVREMAEFLTESVDVIQQRPFRHYGMHVADLQSRFWAAQPSFMKLFYGFTLVLPLLSQDPLSYALPSLGVALFEFSFLAATSLANGQARIVAGDLLNLQAQMAREPKNQLKMALFQYDLLEMIMWQNQIGAFEGRVQLSSYFRLSRLFPLAPAGLLLRAHAGVGAAFKVRAALREEIAARPRYWEKWANWIEDHNHHGSLINVEEIRADWEIRSDRSRIQSSLNYLHNRARTMCEYWLAAFPKRDPS